MRALDPTSELYNVGLVLENQSTYLDEVCRIVKQVFALEAILL